MWDYYRLNKNVYVKIDNHRIPLTIQRDLDIINKLGGNSLITEYDLNYGVLPKKIDSNIYQTNFRGVSLINKYYVKSGEQLNSPLFLTVPRIRNNIVYQLGSYPTIVFLLTIFLLIISLIVISFKADISIKNKSILFGIFILIILLTRI